MNERIYDNIMLLEQLNGRDTSYKKKILLYINNIFYII